MRRNPDEEAAIERARKPTVVIENCTFVPSDEPTGIYLGGPPPVPWRSRLRALLRGRRDAG